VVREDAKSFLHSSVFLAKSFIWQTCGNSAHDCMYFFGVKSAVFTQKRTSWALALFSQCSRNMFARYLNFVLWAVSYNYLISFSSPGTTMTNQLYIRIFLQNLFIRGKAFLLGFPLIKIKRVLPKVLLVRLSRVCNWTKSCFVDSWESINSYWRKRLSLARLWICSLIFCK